MLKRDVRGRFVAGTSPGPGRPRRQSPQVRAEDEALAAALIARADVVIKELETLLARYDRD